MKNKRGLEFSFSWIFGIAVGAFIIFLAIYFAIRAIDAGTQTVQSFEAEKITILFEPMETRVASGKSVSYSLSAETRLYHSCSNSGEFGLEKIRVALKTGFSKNFIDSGFNVSVPNKYIFSSSQADGKKIYIFSRSLQMPFKVADLIIYLTEREKYCFVNAPLSIKDELSWMQFPNLYFNDSIDDCRENGEVETVCFGGNTNLNGCDIIVQGGCSGNCNTPYDYGTVTKNGKTMFYYKDLMYGAVFGDVAIYECNALRLMKRMSKESMLYSQKANFLTSKCGTDSSAAFSLNTLALMALQITQSNEMAGLVSQVNDAIDKNSGLLCPLW